MISRIWHGYTTKDNADTYENLLQKEIFVGIANKNIEGYRGIQLLRRDLPTETEFITIMWFASVDSVRKFAGEDYEKAVVPYAAQKVLSHYDKRSAHYTVKTDEYKFPGRIIL
jgi:heme-degrading monooxygenase HmoA